MCRVPTQRAPPTVTPQRLDCGESHKTQNPGVVHKVLVLVAFALARTRLSRGSPLLRRTGNMPGLEERHWGHALAR